MITFRDFIIFLAENKCLGLYWTNFEKAHFVDEYHRASRLISCFFDEQPRIWLVSSFNWEHSDEGFDYWYNLDTLWNMRCNYLIRNEI